MTIIRVECTLADGLPVIALGDYIPGSPAQVSGPPEDCYPEEPSEFYFNLFWRGKPRDKKLYRCNRELTTEDEEKIYLAADEQEEMRYED